MFSAEAIRFFVYVAVFGWAAVLSVLGWRMGRLIALHRLTYFKACRPFVAMVTMSAVLGGFISYRVPDGETFMLGHALMVFGQYIMATLSIAFTPIILGWAVNHDNSAAARAARYEEKYGAGCND